MLIMMIKKYLCECISCGAHTMARGKRVGDVLELTDKCPKCGGQLIRVYEGESVSTSMATSEDSRYFEEQMLHSNPAIMRRDPLEESDLGVQKSNRRL